MSSGWFMPLALAGPGGSDVPRMRLQDAVPGLPIGKTVITTEPGNMVGPDKARA